MDYSRPELADRLSADYVAGTLRGGARRRFETLLTAHPALRDAVQAWQARLMPLTGSLVPEPPPAHVWKRIEARLYGAPAATVSWWSRLGVWRGLAGFASVAAIAVSVLLVMPREALPPVVVVLASNTPDGAQATPSFVASISADGRAMVTQPITRVALQADRSLELWALPAQGAPRSLGLISPNGATVVQRGKVLDNTAAFAVTLEPPGGSPTGKPTGAVLYLGKLAL